jgi:PAS domain S-box-containing protein
MIIEAPIQAREEEPSDYCRATVDASPVPMAFVAGSGHIIRYANQAFCLLTGQSKQKLIGDSFDNAVPQSDHLLSLLDRVYQIGNAETHVGQEDSASHRFYWSYILWPVFTAANLRVGIMIQVTETTSFHRQATAMNEELVIRSVRQHELTQVAETLNAQLQAEIVQRKASELQYRGLIEAIPQIVWTATPHGTLDFANPKWFEALGIDLITFNQAGWSALLHPDDREQFLQTWSAGLQSGSAFQIEHRLRDVSDSSFRWYLSRAAPICAESGSVVKWFGTSTDIEDQKRAEVALFAKQKLESLGILAGGIAHDFNNLLVPILSGASYAVGILPSTHPLQEIIRGIVSAAESAAQLTRQMLAYAGKGQFLIEQIDINELVRRTCDLVKGSIPKSVKLTVETGQDLPPVEADSSQMQQVVMNIVLNAAESIDESTCGYVTVKTELLDLTTSAIEKFDLIGGNLKPGVHILLEIQDSGCGMDPATKAKVFDPFFTTKFTGRGLGLSAVEGILRTQNGALEIRTGVGRGSTFRIYLPASSRPHHDHKNPSLPIPLEISSALTVLVVDDELMVRQIAKLSLENGGFKVLLADSGGQAMRLVLDKGEAPISLVVLDLSMPGMSGKQVMQQMRASGVKVPILICSGYSEEEVHREFSGLDIAGVLPKPFTSRQLADRVRSMLYPQSKKIQ